MKTELTPYELSEVLGERIKDWIDKSLTFENGCKREQEEEFHQKGGSLFIQSIGTVKLKNTTQSLEHQKLQEYL